MNSITLQIAEFVPTGFLSLKTLLIGLICYIYSSIPYAYIFVYLIKREKITERETGNIGVANAFGVGGLLAGFLTVAGEATKVILPLVFSRYFYSSALTASLSFILVSILGTHFSLFLRGKGGQGSTMLLWTLLLISPWTFLIFSVVFAVLFFLIKNRYQMWILGHAVLPAAIFIIERNIPFVIFGLLVALLYILRYKPSRSDYLHYKSKMRFFRFLEGMFRRNGRFVVNLRHAKDPLKVGFKAKQIRFLSEAGLRVPTTYVCTVKAYDEYIHDPQSVLNRICDEVEGLLTKGRRYSIRSSANLEDGETLSFAGQFETHLNVRSIGQLEKAIISIWDSTRADRVQAYLNRSLGSCHDLKMAVIIQEMVNAKSSGVVFTRNPVNGLDEVVVEAVSGLGNSLAQGRVTPGRWVYKWGSCIERPVKSEADIRVLDEIILQATTLAKKYRKPLDLEWAYDGNELYWLQLRPITGLKGINYYSNKISKEFMPGIIKPLIWSINILVVNTSWKKLFIELIGQAARRIDINKLAKSFYYRAYFNMGIIGDIFQLLGMPRESIELLLGIEVPGAVKPKFRPSLKTFMYLPRIAVFVIRRSIFRRKVERFFTTQGNKYDGYIHQNIDELNESTTLDFIEQLLRENSFASYYVIIVQLLMGFYNMVLSRILRRMGVDAQMIDFSQVRKEIRAIDPSYHLSQLREHYDNLTDENKESILQAKDITLTDSSKLVDFKRRFDEFLLKFGHMSDSGNDFSRVPWRETPDQVIRMVSEYGTHHIMRENVIAIENITKNPLKAWILGYLYRRSVEFRIYRERVTFLYTYGYSLFRLYFLHLAKLFAEKGYFAKREDIFYLTLDEVRQVVNRGIMDNEMAIEMQRRKQEIEECKDIELPGTIIGDALPVPVIKGNISNRLRGVAASKGYSEGQVRVIKGQEDFFKAEDGDILVIPFSDVAWTPLLLKAKAIISESGGMLSHCAIVAREHNIPAVVSVPGILKLEDRTWVVVDGYQGEVLVRD
jgi:pyruvate,water dikinase